MLAAGSRGRQRRFRFKGHVYQFKNACDTPTPQRRTNELVKQSVTVARSFKLKAFLGHKMMPMQSEWPGFDWQNHCIPDLMHDCKLFVDMLLKCIVGYHNKGMYKAWNKDAKHRAECEVRCLVVIL